MKKQKSLKKLIYDWQTAVSQTNLPLPPAYDGGDLLLTQFSEKTSEVADGTCFVARTRTGSDGHPWIGKAIEKGASMILAERSAAEVGVVVPPDVVYWQVEDTALTLAWLAAAWEGFPANELQIIGITGSDGKTTTANLLYEILHTAGLKTGLLSTIRAVISGEDELLELHVTTPEAPVVQSYLRRMADAGVTHCILEVTSHGLAQHRVAGIGFETAVVTNITHEHLDYHGSYDAYFAAKARLFTGQKSWETAVFNTDDSSYEKLKAIAPAIPITYGIYEKAQVMAKNISYTAQATQFDLCFPSETATIKSALVGEFNVYDMLAAATAAYGLGIDLVDIANGLEAVTAVDGRMQRIDRGQPFLTIVDFAHTPFSLEKLIKAGRAMVAGRIIVLFGSAGKRDVEKRKMMASIAARDADLTILTAEDPRTDSLDGILEMMATACRVEGGIEGETFWRVPDRGRAIYHALTLAQPDDLLLICGKGHEQSMCFGTTEYDWDDRTATIAALDLFLKGKQMTDLGLPTFHL